MAAAFPGASVRPAEGLGQRVGVTLGPDAPGRRDPEPARAAGALAVGHDRRPVAGESIATRQADGDICA